MEPLKKGVFGNISKLLTKILNFYAKVWENLLKLSFKSELYLEKYIKKIVE
jgi:competence protein ComGF